MKKIYQSDSSRKARAKQLSLYIKVVFPAKLVLAKAESGNPGLCWIPGQARNDNL
jgi:hypothetical protein